MIWQRWYSDCVDNVKQWLFVRQAGVPPNFLLKLEVACEQQVFVLLF
jgi:hypothetical protein